MLSGRTVPLLAIFSAFTFAIMMFNVPVPGGTTAHGVGGTLTAIVLGPWAAVITTSVALILQALFFGDGGITAIGANCFNMGVVLPFAGYFAYRADRRQQRRPSRSDGSSPAPSAPTSASPSRRSWWASSWASSPSFWSTNGVPDYSPYGFGTAIPAMLVSHMVGASFVEAAITAMAVGYLQKSFPEILCRNAGDATATTPEARCYRTPGFRSSAFGGVALAVVFVAGLVAGHGDLNQWAGLDWTTVDWGDAGLTVLVSAIVSAIALPLIFFVLRRTAVPRSP